MAIDKAWAELTPEATLEPELPICDPHHHLWVHRDGPFIRDLRYLVDDLAADIGANDGGHNIVSTVFIECRACYRADGPAAMQPFGETEFVRGQAAIGDSGLFGKTRFAAGIVGFADLLLGDGVKAVLQAHIEAGGGRFKGIRHSAGWDADERVRSSYTNPKPGSSSIRASVRASATWRPSVSASRAGATTRSSASSPTSPVPSPIPRSS